MLERKVNILVSSPLDDDCLNRISAVSHDVKVYDVSEYVNAERNGDLSHKEQLDALLAEAEVVFGMAPPRDVFARAPKLKWIQSALAGVNHVLTPEIVASPVLVTNARGIHGTQASELTLMLMLMLAKKAHLLHTIKEEKKFQWPVPELLHSKTLTVLGLGAIGREIARLAQAFGMRVMAVRARPQLESKYADVVYSPDQLTEALAQADYVALALPLTPDNTKIIGEAELKTMKPTAFIVNVGRGGNIDEEALVRALKEGWIAGAGLDTFATEPLPADSELWAMTNVIITPHIAGRRPDYGVVATKLFCENLRRYLGGKKMLTLVDKEKGY